MEIRAAQTADEDAIWSIFHAVVKAGDTYPYPPDTDRETAMRLWLEAPRKTLIANVDGSIAGTYYIKDNQPGLGRHVCNCGYMVHPDHRRRGIGKALCEHSLAMARELDYRAMQFNLVVATNTASIALWQAMGFSTVGRLPGAFAHPALGFVDALVMYKSL